MGEGEGNGSTVFCPWCKNIKYCQAKAIFFFYGQRVKNNYKHISFETGFDQVPVNSMQGLDLGGPGAGGGYGSHMDNLPDLGPASGDLNFDSIDPNMGPPPGDNGPSMWFDTDL